MSLFGQSWLDNSTPFWDSLKLKKKDDNKNWDEKSWKDNGEKKWLMWSSTLQQIKEQVSKIDLNQEIKIDLNKEIKLGFGKEKEEMGKDEEDKNSKNNEDKKSNNTPPVIKNEDKIEENSNGDSEEEKEVTLDEILQLAIDNKASDIHFSIWEPVALRIDWNMRFINEIDRLTEEQVDRFTNELMYNDDNLMKQYKDTKEMDCAFEHKSWVNFRVNLFVKRRKKAWVLRRIASSALPIEVLWIPESIKKLLEKKQWMILVTWPTGSWKSTSMQSMLNFINDTRVEHILTIEDPVEFIFTNNKSVFSQREVWPDTLSFKNALKAALREDPDVIMIWEMRDIETIEAALHLAETGHLVISTLHTSSAAQTISRLISNFASDEQEQVQNRLADALIWVLSQRLVRRSDKKWRIWIYEVLIVNTAVRNVIRTWEMWQMWNAMLAGRGEWMVLMKDYADKLRDEWKIEESSYAWFFRTE